jgi:phosphomannomutase
MAKLTAKDIETTKVIRATFENSKWVILVTDETNYIYRVEFEGSESDDNATILTKAHAALLEVDKYEPVVIPEPIIREDLNGLNPGK